MEKPTECDPTESSSSMWESMLQILVPGKPNIDKKG